MEFEVLELAIHKRPQQTPSELLRFTQTFSLNYFLRHLVYYILASLIQTMNKEVEEKINLHGGSRESLEIRVIQDSLDQTSLSFLAQIDEFHHLNKEDLLNWNL